MKSLKLKEDQGSPPVTFNDILKKIIFQPSIDKIKKTYESNKMFSIKQVTEEHLRQVILSIDGSKATSVGDIPGDMLKVTLDMHISPITKIINLSFKNGCFPDDLKLETIHHNLMIAKLGAYGFSQDALQYMRSYLTNRKQRVRVNSNFSTWENIITVIPQGSILGALLFNIFVNDLFLFL